MALRDPVWDLFLQHPPQFPMLIDALVRLGISEKEARAYVMLLRIGLSPVSVLAKRLNMKRVSLYPLLEALQAKALVHFEERDSGRFYLARSPERLLELLDEEKRELKIKTMLAHECVEKLKAIAPLAQNSSQGLALYRGRLAILKMLTATLCLDVPTHVLCSDLTISSPALLCLKYGLKELCTLPLTFYVVQGQMPEAEALFPGAAIQEMAPDFRLPLDAGLLIQGDHTFFIRSNSKEALMTYIQDPVYADSLRSFLRHRVLA